MTYPKTNMKKLIKIFAKLFNDDNGLYTSYSVKTVKGKFTAVVSIEKASEVAAKQTKKIALDFLEFYQKTALLDFYSTGEHHGKPKEIIFERYLDSLKKKR